MDPDMVRQQEEAEREERLRAAQHPPLMPALANPAMALDAVAPLAFFDPPPRAIPHAPRAELEYMAETSDKAEEVLLAKGRVAVADRPTPIQEAAIIRELVAELAPSPPPPVMQDAAALAPIVTAVVVEEEEASSSGGLPLPPSGPVIGAWGAALHCAVFASVGIAGGIAAGTKLQLLAEQGLAIGAAAGFMLGWLSAAITLRIQGLVLWRALAAPVFATIFVLISEVCALHIAWTLPSAELCMTVLGAGGVVAYVLAWVGIRANVNMRRTR